MRQGGGVMYRLSRVTQRRSGRWLSEAEKGMSPGAAVVIVAVSASLLLASIGSILAWRSFEDRIQREHEQLLHAASEAAQAASQFFAGRMAALESVAQMPAVVEEDMEALPPLLEAAAIQQLGFSGGVGWVDSSALLQAHSSIQEVPVDMSDRRFVQHVLESGTPTMGDVVSGRVTGEDLVVIAVPAFQDGELHGLLLGSLRLDRFQEKVPALFPSRFESRIVDRDGNVVMVGAEAGPNQPPANPGILSGPPSTSGTGLMGEPDRVTGMATVEEAGWTVVVQQDENLLLAGVRGRFLGEVAILGLLALLSIGAAVLAARRINASHRQMLQGARSLDALETLSESLSAAPETKDVADTALEVFGKVFSSELVVIGVVDRDDRMRVHMIADNPEDTDPDSPDEVLPLTAHSVLTDAFEDARLMVLGRPELIDRYPDIDLSPDVTGLMVRRFTGRNAKGVVGLFGLGEFPPSTQDRELFAAMVPLLGDAFGRAAAAESERLASRAFQHALLPRDTIGPEVNLQRAVRYIAATGDVEVGGDWYDLWMIDDRHVGVVVGDVVGRGVEAAAAMGQLRSLLRATVTTSTTPGQALARLDELTGQVSGGPSATVALGRFDSQTRELSLASAGHLPPVLVTAGEIRAMYEVRGAPVGFLNHPTSRATVTADLDLGDTVVYYSDGLIERRGEVIDQGIERLRGVLAANLDKGVEALADAILEGCLEADNDDDVALIVLRPVGANPAHFTDSAPVDDFAPALTSLRSWLEVNGHAGETTNILLARIEEALEVVVTCTAHSPSGEMVVEVSTAEGVIATLEYRRVAFGAETEQINRMILRRWQYGEMALSGPRLRLSVGEVPTP